MPPYGFGSLLVTEQPLLLEEGSSPYYYDLVPINQIPVWEAPFLLRDAVRVSATGV
jgi:hypothetical protein